MVMLLPSLLLFFFTAHVYTMEPIPQHLFQPLSLKHQAFKNFINNTLKEFKHSHFQSITQWSHTSQIYHRIPAPCRLLVKILLETNNNTSAALTYLILNHYSEIQRLLPPLIAAGSNLELAHTAHKAIQEANNDINGAFFKVIKCDQLIRTSQEEKIQLLQVLLDLSADINSPFFSECNNTALITATIYGYHKIVKFLLTHPQLKINAQNNCGNTALMIATRNGLYSIVADLLNHPQIDVNVKNNTGFPALFIGAKTLLFFNDHFNVSPLETFKLLLAHPTLDINIQDSQGNTVVSHLILKVFNGFAVANIITQLTLLLNHRNANGYLDVNLTSINNAGKSALDLAHELAHRGQPEILELLQNFQRRR